MTNGLLDVNAGILGENFSVADNTGNTAIGGTLDAMGAISNSTGVVTINDAIKTTNAGGANLIVNDTAGVASLTSAATGQGLTVTGTTSTVLKGGTNSGILTLQDGDAAGGTNISISGSGGGVAATVFQTTTDANTTLVETQIGTSAVYANGSTATLQAGPNNAVTVNSGNAGADPGVSITGVVGTGSTSTTGVSIRGDGQNTRPYTAGDRAAGTVPDWADVGIYSKSYGAGDPTLGSAIIVTDYGIQLISPQPIAGQQITNNTGVNNSTGTIVNNNGSNTSSGSVINNNGMNSGSGSVVNNSGGTSGSGSATNNIGMNTSTTGGTSTNNIGGISGNGTATNGFGNNTSTSGGTANNSIGMNSGNGTVNNSFGGGSGSGPTSNTIGQNTGTGTLTNSIGNANTVAGVATNNTLGVNNGAGSVTNGVGNNNSTGSAANTFGQNAGSGSVTNGVGNNSGSGSAANTFGQNSGSGNMTNGVGNNSGSGSASNTFGQNSGSGSMTNGFGNATSSSTGNANNTIGQNNGTGLMTNTLGGGTGASTNNIGVGSGLAINNIGTGPGQSINTFGSATLGSTLATRAGNTSSYMANGVSTTSVSAGGGVGGSVLVLDGTTSGNSGIVLKDSSASHVVVDANGKLETATGTVAQTSASVTVTNGEGRTHGFYVNEQQATLSGGTRSSSLTLDDNGATFSRASDGAPVQVHGVADGTGAFDAVNVRQLNGAVAASMATTPNLALAPGESGMGMGAGHYGGYSAVGLNFGHHTLDGAHLSFSVAKGLQSGSETAVRASVAWKWR